MDFFPFHTPYQVLACKYIAPLVVSAHLKHALFPPEQCEEIKSLKYLIVELYKSQSAFQALLIRFCGYHPVHTEMTADIS